MSLLLGIKQLRNSWKLSLRYKRKYIFYVYLCEFSNSTYSPEKKRKKKEKQAADEQLLPVCLRAEMKTSKQIQIMVPGPIFVQVCFCCYFVTFCVPVLSCHCWTKLL